VSNLTLIRSFIESRIHEKLSREKILRLQKKRFRKIIKHAYNNSPFYHSLYRSHGITERNLYTVDIENIPKVTKEMLMNNLDDVFTVKDLNKKELLHFLNTNHTPNDLFKKHYHVIHSSGTSGSQGIFSYSKKDWDSFFPYITKTFDFNFARKKTAYVGCIGGHFAALSFTSWLSKGITQLFCNLRILDINKPTEEIVSQLNEFQPDLLGGFFNELKILAEQQEKGILQIQPTTIVNCGEGVIPSDEKYIETTFNAPLNNLYGFAECLISGVGKDDYGGIYLMDDIALIEIKNDHLLLTNLFNKTQPIIRYRIDDCLQIKENRQGKLPFTLIGNIIGRAEKILWFENNEGKMDFVHPFVFVVFYIDGLDRYQIVQKDKTSFDFLAVIKHKDKEKVKEEIRVNLDKLLTVKKFSNVRYSIKVIDDIPIDKRSGKYKLIVTEKELIH